MWSVVCMDGLDLEAFCMLVAQIKVLNLLPHPSHARSAQDISLEEFDDEDLSEITDDCGIGLNYDSDPYEKVRHLH